MNIPITKICVGKDERLLVNETLRSGWVTQGRKVLQFEGMVADYVGAKFAIATSSCTTALHLALIAAGVGKGDEVILPSYTFIATANAVIYCGAKPVLVDIDRLTYNISAPRIKEAITKRTKAIIVVHQVGLPADMDSILALAREYRLKVIEDAACALGSEYKNKKIGCLSELACFSFHPRKVITTGEGGMVATNRKDYAVLIRRLRSHGASISDFSRHRSGRMVFEEFRELGFNYRMPDLCAAVGIAQMRKIQELLKRRAELAEIYNQAFRLLACIDLPQVPAFIRPNYQSYIIRINGRSSISRYSLMQKLLQKGITTRRIHAIHLQPYYCARFGRSSLPETEKALRQSILLPLYYQLTDREQRYVIRSMLDLLR